MSRAAPCPCGSSAAYDACCARFHRGAEPPDASTLMRSRYSAFVKRDAPYLVRTLHPSHDLLSNGCDAALASLRKHFAEGFVYRKLEVLDARDADDSGIAKVLFVVHMARRGRDASFAELSSFASDGTGIRYLTGDTYPVREVPRGTTIAALESR